MLKKPALMHSALIYFVLMYLLPIGAVARLSAASMNRLAAKLLDYPLMISALIHLGVCYAILHWWSDMSLYRAEVLRYTLIAVLLTLSLNLINGYMGEFSCSHPGFMALGAYASSVFTVGLFADDRLFGVALLPHWLGPFFFPVALIFGGLVAAIGALAVAIPSFRTRGDYLAIISLAFMFIVKSLIENLEFVGGPRGLGDQPGWANLPVVFATVVLGIWIINNFVRSTLGKALNAVRDNEMAADAMTVNTRQTKITAFLFAAFWAGVAGGLFAHVLRYVNPGTFGIQKLAEVLAMVYFGGLNSVYGSIVGACSISLLGEMLRPLELFKWIIIPLLLILVMIYRPTGLIAFKEFDVRKLVQPRKKLN
jgi:branched-chain amino acid transport system permease protein